MGDEEIPEDQILEGQEAEELPLLGELEELPENLIPSDLSVDDLLSTALLEGASLQEPNLLDAASMAPQAPSFTLRLSPLNVDQKAALRKILEAQSVSVSEKTWLLTTPVLSQLSEFQAVSLLQSIRALGAHAHCAVMQPEPIPSEDDMALGELSTIAEEALPEVESAPSVALAKGEKDVLLSSPSNLPNSHVLETFGLVIAHRSISRRMFREEEMREKLEKELRSLPNRLAGGLPSSHLQVLLRDLLLDLRKGALAKGANAVLGVKIEAFPESSTSDPLLEQLRLVAFGTAAVVEKT